MGTKKIFAFRYALHEKNERKYKSVHGDMLLL
nr:MAG TPA: hypothetical protein [Caudoviricetes sp.]